MGWMWVCVGTCFSLLHECLKMKWTLKKFSSVFSSYDAAVEWQRSIGVNAFLNDTARVTATLEDAQTRTVSCDIMASWHTPLPAPSAATTIFSFFSISEYNSIAVTSSPIGFFRGWLNLLHLQLGWDKAFVGENQSMSTQSPIVVLWPIHLGIPRLVCLGCEWGCPPLYPHYRHSC